MSGSPCLGGEEGPPNHCQDGSPALSFHREGNQPREQRPREERSGKAGGGKGTNSGPANTYYRVPIGVWWPGLWKQVDLGLAPDPATHSYVTFGRSLDLLIFIPLTCKMGLIIGPARQGGGAELSTAPGRRQLLGNVSYSPSFEGQRRRVLSNLA